jgi:hypothetical protein
MVVETFVTSSRKADVEAFAAADAFVESVEPVDDADRCQRSEE